MSTLQYGKGQECRYCSHFDHETIGRIHSAGNPFWQQNNQQFDVSVKLANN